MLGTQEMNSPVSETRTDQLISSIHEELYLIEKIVEPISFKINERVESVEQWGETYLEDRLIWLLQRVIAIRKTIKL